MCVCVSLHEKVHLREDVSPETDAFPVLCGSVNVGNHSSVLETDIVLCQTHKLADMASHVSGHTIKIHVRAESEYRGISPHHRRGPRVHGRFWKYTCWCGEATAHNRHAPNFTEILTGRICYRNCVLYAVVCVTQSLGGLEALLYEPSKAGPPVNTEMHIKLKLRGHAYIITEIRTSQGITECCTVGFHSHFKQL